MHQIPPKLQSGVDVRIIRDWLNRLRDYVHYHTPKGDGKSIRVSGGCISAVSQSGGRGGANSGSTKWAKVTAVTDANNYTVSVWSSRSSYVDGDSADETSKQCRVPDITDSLAVNDLFPVEASTLTGEDYIAIQQLGDL